MALFARGAIGQPESEPASTNAAQYYRHAAQALETLSNADRELIESTAEIHVRALYSSRSPWSEEPLVRFLRPVPTGAVGAETSARLELGLRLFHQGAALAECDWGFDFQSGNLSSPLPQLPIVRDIVQSALFSARRHWTVGERDRAVGDLEALKAFSTHIGAEGDGGLVSLVVQFNIERIVIYTLNRWLTDAELAAVLRPAAREPNRPPVNLAQKALLLETRTVLPSAKRLIDTSGLTDEKRHERYGTELFAGGLTVGRLVRRYSEDELLTQIERSDGHYREVGRLLELPADSFRNKFDAYMRELAKEDNFFSTIGLVECPGIERVFYDVHELQVRWRMLQAAIDVVEYGTGALPKHDDPFGTGPFAIARTAEGFELRSELEVNGAHVTMAFAAAPADEPHPRDN